MSNFQPSFTDSIYAKITKKKKATVVMDKALVKTEKNKPTPIKEAPVDTNVKPKAEKKPIVRSERSLLNEFATMPIFVYRHKGKTSSYGYDMSRDHALVAVRIDRETKDAFSGKHDPTLQTSAFTCVRLVLNVYENQPMYTLLVNEGGSEDDMDFKDLPSLFKFAREALSNPKFKDTFVSVDEASMGNDGWKTYKRYEVSGARGLKGVTAIKAATIESLHENYTDWSFDRKKAVSKTALKKLKSGDVIKIKSRFGPDQDAVFIGWDYHGDILAVNSSMELLENVCNDDVTFITVMRARITFDNI